MNGIYEDISEPKYKLAKSEADKIWHTLAGEKVPVMLNDIVKAMGIIAKGEDIPKHIKSDGVTQLDRAGKCIIRFRRDISEERKRFTVAHELGHIILGHVSFDGTSSQCSGNAQEKEANSFAGALLVPAKDLKIFMNNNDKTIDDVIKRYWISKEVATIAIMNNGLLNRIKI